MMNLGYTNAGANVKISKSAKNHHISIFGISGSGKSTRIREIVSDLVKNGKTVILFDFDDMPSDYHDVMINKIDAEADGINLELLNTSAISAGLENKTNFLTQMTELLAGTQQLGVRQLGVLREAIEFAAEHRKDYCNDLKAIAEALLLQNSNCANGVYNKLWALLRSGVIRKSDKKIEKGMLNILNLSRYATDTQRALVEIILGMIWRQARITKNTNCNLVIVLDEFQRLRLNKNSILMEMLREARKYDIALILATQSSSILSKEVISAVNQTAISLYFQPAVSEVKKIAAMIDEQQIERYMLLLKKLKKGQSIVTGNIEIEGREMDFPMIINSAYGTKEPVPNTRFRPLNRIGCNK